MEINDIFRYVGLIVCWGIAIIVGFAVFLTLAEGLVAFASTGIGALILAIIGIKLYLSHNKE